MVSSQYIPLVKAGDAPRATAIAQTGSSALGMVRVAQAVSLRTKIQGMSQVSHTEASTGYDRLGQELRLSGWAFNDTYLRFREPLELSVSKEEGLYCVEHLRLGIDAYSETRARLLYETWKQIRMLWREYALERDERLAPAALDLKRSLLEAIEEVRP